MKTVVHNSTAKDKLLHIETSGGIVNIRVGLTDDAGNSITHIEILPDNYAGEIVKLHGSINNRLIRINR